MFRLSQLIYVLILKKLLLPSRVVFVTVLFSLILYVNGAAAGPLDKVVVKTIAKNYEFYVELAENEKTRQNGLMYRRALGDRNGMLFIFPYSAKYNFWMKNTFISLDLLFIAKGGRIVYVHHNAQPQSLASIVPEEKALAVLEINGGLSRRLGIGVGDVVIHKKLDKN